MTDAIEDAYAVLERYRESSQLTDDQQTTLNEAHVVLQLAEQAEKQAHTESNRIE